MSKPFTVSASLVLIAALVVAMYWLGVRHGRAQRPDVGVAPGEAVRILEETPFVVPAGRQLVITALGTRLCTITQIGLEVDGEDRGFVMGDDVPDARYPFHAVAAAGQRVRVYGGLVEDDSIALGYLR